MENSIPLLCLYCEDTIRPRQQAVTCIDCARWQHRTCRTGISFTDYRNAKKTEQQIQWHCEACSQRLVPNHESTRLSFERYQPNTSSATTKSTISTFEIVSSAPNIVMNLMNAVEMDTRDDEIANQHSSNTQNDTTIQSLNEMGSVMDTSIDNDASNKASDISEESWGQAPSSADHLNATYILDRTPFATETLPTSEADENISYAIHEELDESTIVDAQPQDLSDDDDLTAPPVTFQIVDNISQRGKPKLTDSNGYTYVLKYKGKRVTSWRCSVHSRNNMCPVNVRQIGDNFILENAHTHAVSIGGASKLAIRREVKEVAVGNVFRSASSIVDDILRDRVDTSAPGDIPRPQNLVRLANRTREKLRPQDPTDLGFDLRMDYVPTIFLEAT